MSILFIKSHPPIKQLNTNADLLHHKRLIYFSQRTVPNLYDLYFLLLNKTNQKITFIDFP